MKFHPFKLKIFKAKDGEVLTDIQSFIDNKQIISLLYIECPIMNKTLHVGDLFYNKEENKYYIFSLFKCENIGFTYGVNGFGFTELSFLNNDIKDIFFNDIFYEEINNSNFKNMLLNQCLFMGNIFLIEQDNLNYNKEFNLPFINKKNYKQILDILFSENFIVMLGIGDRSLDIREISKKLPLLQEHLDNLLNGNFSIKLNEKRSNAILEEEFRIIAYTGNIHKVKQEKLDSYLDYVLFYDKYRSKILSYQNKHKIKIHFNEFIEAINFYKEVICILTDKGIEYINTNKEDTLNNSLRLLINPTSPGLFDFLEEDFNDEDYVTNLLKIIS